jgi:hypothetical protein
VSADCEGIVLEVEARRLHSRALEHDPAEVLICYVNTTAGGMNLFVLVPSELHSLIDWTTVLQRADVSILQTGE